MTKLAKSRTLAGISAALTLTLLMSAEAPCVFASSPHGAIHITKDCANYTGLAGGYCTIKTSDVAQIPGGSNVYYDQAAGVPAGLLDSNVVLDAGSGNRALGRCTVDASTGAGLCTFSDGLGHLSGFTARIVVSYLGGTLYAWDGTYSFEASPGK